MKYIVGGVIAIVALAVILFVLVSLFMMASRGGHTQPLKGPDAETRPFVTNEPGDQKANQGMYADAKGPPWNVPQAGMTQLPFGICGKPAVAIGVDERGNNIYAEDDEVIWRCVQTHPTGEIVNAPHVYCFLMKEQPSPYNPVWNCYHDYSVVYSAYEHDYGRAPLILPDEIEFIDTTEYKQ